MKTIHRMFVMICVGFWLLGIVFVSNAQSPSSKGRKAYWFGGTVSEVRLDRGLATDTTPADSVPVSMVVTVKAKQGGIVPLVYREDVRAYQGRDQVQVMDWVPLQGDQAGLELYVLIDDAADSSISFQFGDLRQFIAAQPATTSIAVGYIRFGMVDIVQNLSKDHSQAAKALRPPVGIGAGTDSPYGSIQDLIKRWPKSAARREILMITSGIDRQHGDSNRPYLLPTLEQAQRAGIQVHAIYAYASAEGSVEHSQGRLIIWGQNDLAQLADDTGGEAYFQYPEQTPIAFALLLDQIADRLKHQYRLTVLAEAASEARYQRIRLETEVPNAELVAAESVYVPAAK